MRGARVAAAVSSWMRHGFCRRSSTVARSDFSNENLDVSEASVNRRPAAPIRERPTWTCSHGGSSRMHAQTTGNGSMPTCPSPP